MFDIHLKYKGKFLNNNFLNLYEHVGKREVSVSIDLISSVEFRGKKETSPPTGNSEMVPPPLAER